MDLSNPSDQLYRMFVKKLIGFSGKRPFRILSNPKNDISHKGQPSNGTLAVSFFDWR